MSLRDLNWRKGLFRLWLFLSAIWIAMTGILGLYPATSRYIETVKAAHELKSLRATVSYTFLESQDNKSQAATGIVDPWKKSQPEAAVMPKTLTDDQMAALLQQSPKPAQKVPSDGLTDDQVSAVLKGEAKLPAGYSLDEKHYNVRESQTGVTVTFVWYNAQPPGQTDLDEVFTSFLGQQYIRWDPDPNPTPNDWRPRWSTPRRKVKLSENESCLVSKLQRIRELEKILDSLKSTRQDFLVALSTVFLPPLALLVFGTGLLWALSGFAPKQNS
jgi:hypothetical protein